MHLVAGRWPRLWISHFLMAMAMVMVMSYSRMFKWQSPVTGCVPETENSSLRHFQICVYPDLGPDINCVFPRRGEHQQDHKVLCRNSCSNPPAMRLSRYSGYVC